MGKTESGVRCLAHPGTVSIASEDVRVVYLGYLMQEIWDSALLQVLEGMGLLSGVLKSSIEQH